MSLAKHGNNGKGIASKKNQGGKGKFKGKCHQCGKTGHKATDCWDNTKNADKCPQWFKPSKVTAATNIKKSEELQLVNVNWGAIAEAFAKDDKNVDYETGLALLLNQHVQPL